MARRPALRWTERSCGAMRSAMHRRERFEIEEASAEEAACFVCSFEEVTNVATTALLRGAQS